MHGANPGRIVVDQADDLRVKFTLHVDLLVHLTPDRVPKRLFGAGAEETVVIGIDMAADADRSLGDESFLARFFAADVMKNLFAVGDDNVRNQLFKGGIVLRERPRPEAVILRVENGRQIARHVTAETLKRAQFIQHGSLETKNLFLAHAIQGRGLVSGFKAYPPRGESNAGSQAI